MLDILNKINQPEDLRNIEINDLEKLSEEIREVLLQKLSKNGGHFGPNFGMVEAIIAMHYVFDSPKDKFVFDVSHQSYAHKILTGRKEGFIDENSYRTVSGYTNPDESEHDFFNVGHTSTSISLASGLAKARDLKKEDYNIVAVIGDGSLSGGEALEGLNFAGSELNSNFIIIVNDNQQSIAENHGGLYKNLDELRETNGQASNNLFKAMGLDYIYEADGNNIEKMIELFQKIKDIDHPIVVHINTIKGKGYKLAEENREAWHAGGPFHVEDGSPRFTSGSNDTTVFDSIKTLLGNNKKAIVLNAGTPMGLGFTQDVRQEYVDRGQFIDVGIAEENMVAMSSGIAKNGGTAVFGTYTPFLQRTYDQLSHDLCLNDNPAVMLVLSPGVYGMNSNTHIALCDIQMFAHIPNLIYLAPATKEEYEQMFKYATTQKDHPVGIRIPASFVSSGIKDETDYSVLKNKVEIQGEKFAIFAVGCMLALAKKVAEKIKEEIGIQITVINPRFLTGLDIELLEKLKKNHTYILTLEDGELVSGYGQNIASYYGDSDIKVKNYGISKVFHTDYDPIELLAQNGMSVENLSQYIQENI